VKRGWSVAERFVGQLADDGVANDPVAAAPSAPVISSVWLAFQDGLLPGDVLAGAGQIEGVESAECRKVRGRESRLGHVEVFRMDCVRTSIIGRPRRLSAQRRAVSWNHRSTLSFTKSRVTRRATQLTTDRPGVSVETPGDIPHAEALDSGHRDVLAFIEREVATRASVAVWWFHTSTMAEPITTRRYRRAQGPGGFFDIAAGSDLVPEFDRELRGFSR
jgi:hypothetical protein